MTVAVDIKECEVNKRLLISDVTRCTLKQVVYQETLEATAAAVSLERSGTFN